MAAHLPNVAAHLQHPFPAWPHTFLSRQVLAELSAFYRRSLYATEGAAVWTGLLDARSFSVLLRDAQGIVAAVPPRLRLYGYG